MIKKIFSVATGFDQSDEKEFWIRKTPLERLEAIELMRQILYNYDPTSERLQRFFTVEVFKEFGFDVDELKEDLFLKKNKIIRIGEPPLRIEVMTSVSGVNFDACYQKRIVETIDGTQVYFINLENLKRNKLAAGRHKDLNDLENLP